VYIGIKIVVTSNNSTILGIANGTLAFVSSINLPASTTFAPLTTRLADVPTLVQVASVMPTSIVIEIAGRASMANEPHPVFEGLTKCKFPLLLPRLTFVKMTLANRGGLTVACDTYPAIAADSRYNTGTIASDHFIMKPLRIPAHSPPPPTPCSPSNCAHFSVHKLQGMSLAAFHLGSFSDVSAASACVIFTRLQTLNGVYLNGQLPPGFVKRVSMDRNFCKEMVRICLMASATAILLGSLFDAAVLSRYETNLQSLSIQQPHLQRRLPAPRAELDFDSHEPATAALLHGDLGCTAERIEFAIAYTVLSCWSIVSDCLLGGSTDAT